MLMSGSLVEDSQMCNEKSRVIESSLDRQYRFWYLSWTFLGVLKTEVLKTGFIIFLNCLKCLLLSCGNLGCYIQQQYIYRMRESGLQNCDLFQSGMGSKTELEEHSERNEIIASKDRKEKIIGDKAVLNLKGKNI